MPTRGSTRFLAFLAILGIGATAAAQDEAEHLSARFREAAKAILPSVVSVRSSGEGEVLLPEIAPPFGRRFPMPIGPEPGMNASGVVIDAERGLVLTNDHALGPSGTADVVLADGRRRPATKVVRDARSDLALLTIDPAGLDLKAAEWGDSDALEIGDWVLAVGDSFGYSGSVSAGIVGGKGRSINPSRDEALIQTDAAIQPGNSGGPLVDLGGRVVGICTAIQSRAGVNAGVGFAIPASRARRVAEDLARFGKVRRGYLGIRIGEPDPAAVAERGRAAGVPISAVMSPSPAAEAGLKPGDLVLKVGDRAVASGGEIRSAVEFAPIGEPLTLTIVRDGQEQQVGVKPGEMPESSDAAPGGRPFPGRERGLRIPRAGPEPDFPPGSGID
jgi:serine protease Do